MTSYQLDKPPSSPSLAIELSGISKSFGPVHANRNISMAVTKGTIHGIVGENGAGKSTLMSILYGFYQADHGEMKINGKKVTIRHSDDAIAAGIGMVHQHFMLVKPFTVLENVILGAEDGIRLQRSSAKARDVLQELAAAYGLEVDPDAVVGDLSVGLQQRVEILKALYRQAEILILDEPTGVLTPSEADHLFRILDSLKAQGKTIIFITHKLREIMSITDSVSVMRRGEMTATHPTSQMDVAKLAELMVGRTVDLNVKKSEAHPGENVLSIRDLTVEKNGTERLKSVSLDIRAGEILGVAGVAGNGQSELLEVIAGMAPAKSGEIRLNGAPLDISRAGCAAARRNQRIGHVPEDRHRHGLVMPFSIWENASYGYHRDPSFTKGFFSLPGRMKQAARDLIGAYDVRPDDPFLKTANLSGGNQQKVVLAREIGQNPDLLLIGQPTRGVDIGAIEYIHREIVALRDRGKAILLVSVELDEILGLSDRIVVMFDGQISGERYAADTDEHDLGMLMAGVNQRESNDATASKVG
ncbi:ABC transporter ATP-binding protein [Sinorhizobium meliloti]|uniref:ABC transporter ATP-binding protein n=1 Tax=Rhizobium meliloti TaxID=382 RepID=UPI00398D007F